MSYRVRAELLSMDWNTVRMVSMKGARITVITSSGPCVFDFNSSVDAKVAMEDWLQAKNAGSNFWGDFSRNRKSVRKPWTASRKGRGNADVDFS
jgi:hypothetical protein